jgi:hypothetical protein
MSVFASPAGVTGSVFAGGGFSPRKLFAAGEQGVWYDPSDISTLFTDVAGTTPVTAAGQEVARINDKSGRGNHATQGTLAARPFYAVVPKTGRRNLLTFTEQFGNASWTINSGGVVTANAATAPDGLLTADQVAGNGTNFSGVRRNVASTPGTSYVSSLYVKQNTSSHCGMFVDGGNLSGTLNFSTGSISGSGFIAENVGNGWFRISVARNATGVSHATVWVFPSEGAATSTNSVFVWGAQIELGSAVTAYQRVVTQYDVNEAGVEALHYLSFDGTDDSLATSAIDFTATDAVAVHAGVRKVSDTARGTIAELTASVAANNGGFHLTAPNAASDTFAFESKGTALTDAVATGIAAPATRILSGIADISADNNILRVNGVQADSEAGDQGTGTYANAILYVGRRGGASLPFNGHLYGLIVRGAASSTAQISSAERWLARKTGVVI